MIEKQTINFAFHNCLVSFFLLNFCLLGHITSMKRTQKIDLKNIGLTVINNVKQTSPQFMGNGRSWGPLSSP